MTRITEFVLGVKEGFSLNWLKKLFRPRLTPYERASLILQRAMLSQLTVMAVNVASVNSGFPERVAPTVEDVLLVDRHAALLLMRVVGPFV